MTGGNEEAFAGFVDRLVARLGPVDVPAAVGDGIIHAAVLLLLRCAAAGTTKGAVAGAGASAATSVAACTTAGATGDATAGAEILFIKRSERRGDPWSGHLAFPGGHAEPSDASLTGVAVRETREEVGIDLERGGRVLGSLPLVRPLSARLPSIAVTPFVAIARKGATARPDPSEVEDAFWMPLAALKNAGPVAVVRRAVEGEIREWPAYASPRGPIWGITERILSGFLALLEDRLAQS